MLDDPLDFEAPPSRSPLRKLRRPLYLVPVLLLSLLCVVQVSLFTARVLRPSAAPDFSVRAARQKALGAVPKKRGGGGKRKPGKELAQLKGEGEAAEGEAAEGEAAEGDAEGDADVEAEGDGDVEAEGDAEAKTHKPRKPKRPKNKPAPLAGAEGGRRRSKTAKSEEVVNGGKVIWENGTHQITTVVEAKTPSPTPAATRTASPTPSATTPSPTPSPTSDKSSLITSLKNKLASVTSPDSYTTSGTTSPAEKLTVSIIGVGALFGGAIAARFLRRKGAMRSCIENEAYDDLLADGGTVASADGTADRYDGTMSGRILHVFVPLMNSPGCDTTVTLTLLLLLPHARTLLYTLLSWAQWHSRLQQ
ncbi:hypothetical protein TeGR_g11450 [Tetraparma gracilis]|uniref:Uncharacterized protein n=1 Tax=Tetraparma gracilis TaxID=2962635 RepID=A0ABQ6N8D8_9STRA|nr:hypothetical protein TeGR_g11450 [Tetraparma gracilis]